MPTLHPAQLEGVDAIQKSFASTPHKGFLLGDRVGLGKTAQALHVIKNKAALIIVPSYLLPKWVDEFDLWGFNRENICVIDSTKQVIEDKQYYLTSYNMASHTNIHTQLMRRAFDVLVLDEAHYCKTWNSLRSNKILGTFKNKKSNLLYQSKNVLCMTGTFIKRDIEDLYNIVIRVAPGALNYMSKMQFFQTFAARLEYTAWGIKPHGVQNEAELKKLIAPIYLAREYIEGLPDKVDEILKLSIKGAKIQKLFAEEETFLKTRGITLDNADKLLHLSRPEAAELAGIRAKIAVLKIPQAMDIIDDLHEDEGSLVIFAYHKSVTSALEEKLKVKYKNKIIAVCTGEVSAKKRHEHVLNFQKGQIDFLICTIGALQEGEDLFNGSCVVFLELDYSPATMSQCIGRVYRRGQKKIVRVVKIVIDKCPVEIRIQNILRDKNDIIARVL